MKNSIPKQSETNVTKDLLLISKSNGVFDLYSIPELKLIHSLNIIGTDIYKSPISTCCISPTGDYIGFASSKLNMLNIWDWKSETYVLRQQNHYFNVNSSAY